MKEPLTKYKYLLHFLFYFFFNGGQGGGNTGVGCLELMDSNKQIAGHIPAFAVNLYKRYSPGEVIGSFDILWQLPEEGSNQLESCSIYSFTENSIKIINKRTHECEGTAHGVGGSQMKEHKEGNCDVAQGLSLQQWKVQTPCAKHAHCAQEQTAPEDWDHHLSDSSA